MIHDMRIYFILMICSKWFSSYIPLHFFTLLNINRYVSFKNIYLQYVTCKCDADNKRLSVFQVTSWFLFLSSNFYQHFYYFYYFDFIYKYIHGIITEIGYFWKYIFPLVKFNNSIFRSNHFICICVSFMF